MRTASVERRDLVRVAASTLLELPANVNDVPRHL
jgi:hypothetical protein